SVAHRKFSKGWPRFKRCCQELTESSPEVCWEVLREFVDRFSRAHREFIGRMLGVRREFTEGDRELAGGSPEGCREFTRSSPRDQLTIEQ
ncbi:hypothetical protein GW17_00058128, partial [Ensete ventricosum]